MHIRVEISSASALAHLLPLLRLIHLSFVCGCGWLWMHGYCIYHYTTIISELESVPSASAHLPFLRSPFFAPTSVLPPSPTGGSFPDGGGHIDRISPDFPLTLHLHIFALLSPYALDFKAASSFIKEFVPSSHPELSLSSFPLLSHLGVSAGLLQWLSLPAPPYQLD